MTHASDSAYELHTALQEWIDEPWQPAPNMRTSRDAQVELACLSERQEIQGALSRILNRFPTPTPVRPDVRTVAVRLMGTRAFRCEVEDVERDGDPLELSHCDTHGTYSHVGEPCLYALEAAEIIVEEFSGRNEEDVKKELREKLEGELKDFGSDLGKAIFGPRRN